MGINIQLIRGKGNNLVRTFVDLRGYTEKVHLVDEVDYVRFSAYKYLNEFTSNKCEELAAANKALAEERELCKLRNKLADAAQADFEKECLEHEKTTREYEQRLTKASKMLNSRIEDLRSMIGAETEAHEKTKRDFASEIESHKDTKRSLEWSDTQGARSIERVKDLQRELAAARKEIKALKSNPSDMLADIYQIIAIHSDLAKALNCNPFGVPLDLDRSGAEACFDLHKVLIKYAPCSDENPAPSPAPVEYECPGCGAHSIGEHGRKENKYLVCVGCGEQSGRYKRGEAEGPPESWIKKQEKPAPAPVEYACPECGGKSKEHKVPYPYLGNYRHLRCRDCGHISGRYQILQGKPHESWIKKQEEPSA